MLTRLTIFTLALCGACATTTRRLGRGGGLQAPCNRNKDCQRGYRCQSIYGSPNANGQCIPKNRPDDDGSCWLGPECNEKVVGVKHSTNWDMINNNCYVKKQMCKAHNHPSPSPASICYANKGGMCVPLQQTPGWISSVSGQCWATIQQCQQHLPSGGGGDKKSKGERQCNRCLRKPGSTFCWRDHGCYPTGFLFNPCTNQQCASHSRLSTCSIANSGCKLPAGN